LLKEEPQHEVALSGQVLLNAEQWRTVQEAVATLGRLNLDNVGAEEGLLVEGVHTSLGRVVEEASRRAPLPMSVESAREALERVFYWLAMGDEGPESTLPEVEHTKEVSELVEEVRVAARGLGGLKDPEDEELPEGNGTRGDYGGELREEHEETLFPAKEAAKQAPVEEEGSLRWLLGESLGVVVEKPHTAEARLYVLERKRRHGPFASDGSHLFTAGGTEAAKWLAASPAAAAVEQWLLSNTFAKEALAQAAASRPATDSAVTPGLGEAAPPATGAKSRKRTGATGKKSKAKELPPTPPEGDRAEVQCTPAGTGESTVEENNEAKECGAPHPAQDALRCTREGEHPGWHRDDETGEKWRPSDGREDGLPPPPRQSPFPPSGCSGPWEVREKGVWLSIVRKGAPEMARDVDTVCEQNVSEGEERLWMRANFKRMAAAPDMVDALEQQATLLERLLKGEPLAPDELAKALARVQGVLRKAGARHG
jgi:hypothetical protein